jgi:flagellar basal body-associated protein FliL
VSGAKRRKRMLNIFYIIGVVVVVLALLGYFRLG